LPSPSACRGAGERDGSRLTLSSNVEQGEAGFGIHSRSIEVCSINEVIAK